MKIKAYKSQHGYFVKLIGDRGTNRNFYYHTKARIFQEVKYKEFKTFTFDFLESFIPMESTTYVECIDAIYELLEEEDLENEMNAFYGMGEMG